MSTVRALRPVTPAPVKAPRARKARSPRPAKSTTGAVLAKATMGAFPPVASFVLSHVAGGTETIAKCLVAGGLLYSAPTVYGWARGFVGHWTKALGFVALLEGVLVASPVDWLRYWSLAILIGANALIMSRRSM